MSEDPGPDVDRPTGDQSASKPRRRLLTLLRRSDTALDVYELAAGTGLHITTVRFHLDVLTKADLITSQTLPRTTPGRPRTVYTSRVEETPHDAYRQLAALLAANLGPTPRTRRHRAEKAGRDWATNLLSPAAQKSPDYHETAARITDMLAEMNFDPALAPAAPGTGELEIRLRACPYRDVARAHPEVVCAIHEGLLHGALNQFGGPPVTARLRPFVTPKVCVVSLMPNPPATGPRPDPPPATRTATGH